MSFENYPVEFERLEHPKLMDCIRPHSKVQVIRHVHHLSLRLKRQPTVPLEVEVLSPNVVSELSNAQIRALTIYHGSRQLPR